MFQGAAAAAILGAFLTALATTGPLIAAAVTVLRVFHFIPLLLVAIRLGDQAFLSEVEQECLVIGRTIGAAITGFIAALKLKTLEAFLTWALSLSVHGVWLERDYAKIGQCLP